MVLSKLYMYAEAVYRPTVGVLAFSFIFFFHMSQGDMCGLTQHGCNVGVAGLKKTENCCLN